MDEQASGAPPTDGLEKKAETSQLSPAEIESMIRIRHAVERELLWKYSVAAVILGGLLTGGAAAGFWSVYSMSNQFFAIAKDRVDEVAKNSKELLSDFRAAERRLQEESAKEENKFQKSVADLTQQIEQQQHQTEAVSANLRDAQGQSATLQNQTAKAIEGLRHAAEVVAALDKTNLSNDCRPTSKGFSRRPFARKSLQRMRDLRSFPTIIARAKRQHNFARQPVGLW
jgi:hypothetical protein